MLHLLIISIIISLPLYLVALSILCKFFKFYTHVACNYIIAAASALQNLAALALVAYCLIKHQYYMPSQLGIIIGSYISLDLFEILHQLRKRHKHIVIIIHHILFPLLILLTFFDGKCHLVYILFFLQTMTVPLYHLQLANPELKKNTWFNETHRWLYISFRMIAIYILVIYYFLNFQELITDPDIDFRYALPLLVFSSASFNTYWYFKVIKAPAPPKHSS